MKISVNWLKDYVILSVPFERVAERLTMAGLEVESVERRSEFKDQVLNLEITSNRPDWLSHVGVAREIHALLGSPFHFPEWKNPPAGKPKSRTFRVEIRARDLCPYYTAALLEGVGFGPTPEFIRRRLESVGLRPINLVVDITNYVLLEMGQPLHAFDWDRLNPEKIVARRARRNEKIVALDGTEYSLDPEDLLIADADRPIAIAGVMGGQESEVSEKTRNILLESAYFAPTSVRRSSKRLGLVSESSYRFERGVDPRGVDIGRERAIYLLRKYAKSIQRIHPVVRGGRPPIREKTVLFPLSEVKRIVGTGVPPQKALSVLNGLGLEVRSRRGDSWKVKVPSYRQDISRPIDLVEEIVRIHGYDKIPETLPSMAPAYSGESAMLRLEEALRDLAIGFGLHEVVTYSLISESLLSRVGWQFPKGTRIINRQNQELTLMRPTFFPSLIEVVQTNLFRGLRDVRIFEIASLYEAEGERELPRESKALGMALAGSEEPHWLEKGRPYELYDLKGLWERLFKELGTENYSFRPTRHPILEEGTCLSIEWNRHSVGVFGALSKRVLEFYDIEAGVLLGEILLEKLAALLDAPRKFQSLAKYPAAERDLALIVNESIQAEELRAVMKGAHPTWVKKVEVFDLYRGQPVPAGKKSLAFRIEYRADDHTLTAKEVNEVQELLTRRLTERFQAEIRR